MSTFDGTVQEFPFITIDYFRRNPERPPPLACFLSHAHSDHLQGLESFRAPFIYCSAATRELLLRIEKYPHRMNFNNGILESRRLHYKHLSKLLRPIPLNTPTEIDLTPRLSIRVTLLDANHCTGAVMFLIEGDGKAILYTGDIRAEPWWVDSLIRHPILIPYTLGTKRLDKIYLDTTFAEASHAFHTFPTKAEGLAELLRKLEPYPEDTIFYFRAWTFGYEEVWMALSAALKSKVHVDRYQMGLYRSVFSSYRDGGGAIESPSLCGFELGSRIIPGCLSGDEGARIHSCEPGVHCSTVSSKRTVYITPIISRTKNGSDVPELGAGGGLGDLYQIHELELPNQSSLERLEQLCREKIHDSEALSRAREALLEASKSKNRALSLGSYGMKDTDEMPLDELVNILSRGRPSEKSIFPESSKTSTETRDRLGKLLPSTIRFPYSRHSSYAELCDLVAAFKPKDIHPCTVDPSDWDEDISMQSLFGHLCSDNKFVHDQYMRGITAAETGQRSRKRPRRDPESSTQSTQQSNLVQITTEANEGPVEPRSHTNKADRPATNPILVSLSPLPSSERTPVPSSLEAIEDINNEPRDESDSLHIPASSPGTAKARRKAIRQAWHLLQEARKSQNRHFQLGSLPSSWPTDDENSQIVPNASQQTTDRDSGTQDSQHTTTSQEEEDQIPSSGTINEGNMNTDTYVDYDPSTQQSHTPSISSSAFASQGQSQSQNQILREDENEHELVADELSLLEESGATEQNANPNSSSESQRRHLFRRESSLQNRKAAYRAARADSYDAWASASLVSAGNNHTEEEVEL